MLQLWTLLTGTGCGHTQHIETKPCQTKHITPHVLYCSVSRYIALNLAILIKKVITWWWCGVMWFILAIIGPPQLTLFNFGLDWVVATIQLTSSWKKYMSFIKYAEIIVRKFEHTKYCTRAFETWIAPP